MSVFSALGAGNMANAILSGAVASGYLEPSAVGTYNRGQTNNVLPRLPELTASSLPS